MPSSRKTLKNLTDAAMIRECPSKNSISALARLSPPSAMYLSRVSPAATAACRVMVIIKLSMYKINSVAHKGGCVSKKIILSGTADKIYIIIIAPLSKVVNT